MNNIKLSQINPNLSPFSKSLQTRIKFIAKTGSGTTPNSKNDDFYKDGSLNWIQSGDLYGKKYIDCVSKRITEKAVRECNLKYYTAPFIVVAMYGASIGNISISKIDAYTNQACCILSPNKNIDIKYLYYAISSAKKDLLLDSIGGTQPNISQEKIKNLHIYVPPLEQQHKIANYIDKHSTKIDYVITQRKSIIKKLEQYKESVITQAVTKGLEPNVEMRDSGVRWIGKIAKLAGVYTLKYDTYMKGRIGWQGLKSKDFIDDGPYCVTSTDFENGKVNWSKCYHVSLERYNMDPFIQIKEGDLLISKDGTIGKLALIEKLPNKACLNSHLLILRPLNNKYLTKYLYYVLKSKIFTIYYELVGSGSTMQSLSQEKLGQFSFPLWGVKTQLSIVNFLDLKCADIDAAIEKQKHIIEKLEEYRDSIIYYAINRPTHKV